MAFARPEAVVQAFEAAWNAHAMQAFGALFHDDATFVNRFGRYVRGVEAILAMHVPIHETIYRGSRLTNELIDAIALSEAASIVHFWSRLSVGDAHPAGPHSIDTVILAVVTRHEGDWLIQSLENVTLADPRSGQPILR
jgi:uncharacterized protein (TIGR02246 family)